MTLTALDRIIELAKAPAEVRAARDEVTTLAKPLVLALNEAVRAIEEAPHGFDCSYFRNSCRENDGTITCGNCNCWKRTALDRINELLTNP